MGFFFIEFIVIQEETKKFKGKTINFDNLIANFKRKCDELSQKEPNILIFPSKNNSKTLKNL